MREGNSESAVGSSGPSVLFAARRIERPEIRLPSKVRAATRDVQLDLEVLLAAAVYEQAALFRSLSGALLENARRAFEMGIVGAVQGAHWSHSAVAEHARRIAELLVAARVLGIVQTRHQAGIEFRVSSFDLRFSEVLGGVPPQEAIGYLRKLPVMTRGEWERAIAEQQTRAFTISGIENRVVLEQMKELVTRSLEAGLSPAQFETNARELLRNYETTAAKLRTMWNTNVGQAMANGRQEALKDPEVRSVLGWQLFDAVNDQFTRENHAELDNGLAPYEWWAEHEELQPLLGFNCRCVLLPVTAAKAERLLAQGGYQDLREGVPAGAGRDEGF